MDDLRINLKEQAGLRAREDPVRGPVRPARPPERRATRRDEAAARPEERGGLEARGQTGEGVFKALEAVAKGVLSDLKRLSR